MSKPSAKLFTSQLTLERAGPSDFWVVWDIWSELDISRQVFGEHPPSLDDAINAYDAWQAGANEGLGLWMIKPFLGGQAIGCVSLARRQFEAKGGTQLSGPVEFQIAMRSSMRNMGRAHEAARAVIRHGFSGASLPCITASSEAGDTPINGLLARLGFRVVSEHVGPQGGRVQHAMTHGDFAEALTAPAPLR